MAHPHHYKTTHLSNSPGVDKPNEPKSKIEYKPEVDPSYERRLKQIYLDFDQIRHKFETFERNFNLGDLRRDITDIQNEHVNIRTDMNFGDDQLDHHIQELDQRLVQEVRLIRTDITDYMRRHAQDHLAIIDGFTQGINNNLNLIHDLDRSLARLDQGIFSIEERLKRLELKCFNTYTKDAEHYRIPIAIPP
jgi:phage host-nuclease inhibitor protein Gam